MNINTNYYTPNFTQLQTLNDINGDSNIRDRSQAEQNIEKTSAQDGFSSANSNNAPNFDRLQALETINNDGSIQDKSLVEPTLLDSNGENVEQIYNRPHLDVYT
ncbi:hypothetical protein [Helicobacter cetorum]|uniref:hypothetical protein n=1 Tax=Helicobacter cetorum TaxID=138563 RepID=UPI000CF1931D|nr:hypothetical protein [Helicobacter cetorum]